MEIMTISKGHTTTTELIAAAVYFMCSTSKQNFTLTPPLQCSPWPTPVKHSQHQQVIIRDGTFTHAAFTMH